MAGWGIVNHQANRRELRKEQRAVVDAAKKIAIEVAAQAAAYHCSGSRDEAVEWDIKTALDQLELELKRLPNYPASHSLVPAMAGFADAVTGGDFESANRVARTRADSVVLAVVSSRNTLLGAIESQFTSSWG